MVLNLSNLILIILIFNSNQYLKMDYFLFLNIGLPIQIFSSFSYIIICYYFIF